MKVWCVWIHVNLQDIYQFLSPAERFLISFLYSVPFFRSLNHAGSLVSLQRPLLHYSLQTQPSLGSMFSAILWRTTSECSFDEDIALISTANVSRKFLLLFETGFSLKWPIYPLWQNVRLGEFQIESANFVNVTPG